MVVKCRDPVAAVGEGRGEESIIQAKATTPAEPRVRFGIVTLSERLPRVDTLERQQFLDLPGTVGRGSAMRILRQAAVEVAHDDRLRSGEGRSPHVEVAPEILALLLTPAVPGRWE